MKTQLRITRPNNNNHLNDAAGFRGFLLGSIRRKTALLASVATGVLCGAQTSPAHPPEEIGAIFVIAMENHNFTQPPTQTSPQQIFGNPAAPFQNSLITPGQSERGAGFLCQGLFQRGHGRSSVRTELRLG